MKKSLCILLVLTIICIGSPFAKIRAAEAPDNTVRGVLTAIGIDCSMEESQEIKRGDAVKMVMSLMGADEFANYNRPVFIDVTRETENSAEINTAYELGLFGKNNQNMFYPERNAGQDIMIEMLVNMLGYAEWAQMRGDYPNGYYQMALELGILNQIEDSQTLSAKDAERMIYNALNVKIASDDGSRVTISNTSFLNGRLNLYKRTGMVTAYKNKRVANNSAENKTIQIDGVEYKLENTEINTDVGHTVEFLYRENEDESNTIIFITELTGDASVLFIDKDEIDEVSTKIDNNRIAYMGHGKKHTLKLESNRGLVNGMSKNIENSDLDFSDYDGGYIKLIPDRRGKYQYMEIVKYNNYIVSALDVRNQTVMCEGGKKIILDANEYSQDVLINVTDKYYNDLTIENIKVGDTISVYESSNGNFLGIFVSSEMINAEVTSIAENSKEIKLDGQSYRVSCNINCEVGKKYNVSLDFRNTISKFAVDVFSTDYAYLIDVYKDDDGSVKIKLFTAAAGEVEIYSVKNKFSIKTGSNSQKFNDEDIDAVKNALSATADDNGNGIAQLVRLRTNSENQITSITTAVIGTKDKNNFSRDYEKSGMNSQSIGFVDGRFRISSGETVIFRVPGDRSKSEAYHADMDMPTACTIGTGYLYDINEDTNVPGAIVVNMDTVQYSRDAMKYGAVCVIESVCECYDDEWDEFGTLVEAYIDGNKREFKFRQGEYLKDIYGSNAIEVSSLKCGDVLQGRYVENTFVCAQKLYNSPLGDGEGLVPGIITDTSMMSGFVIGTGYPRAIYDKYAIVYNDETGIEFITSISSVRVYIVDVRSRTVRLGSPSDLTVYTDFLYRKTDGYLSDVVIYE